jgi:hypothetical protein
VRKNFILNEFRPEIKDAGWRFKAVFHGSLFRQGEPFRGKALFEFSSQRRLWSRATRLIEEKAFSILHLVF